MRNKIRDLVSTRELIYYLAKRDIVAKYKQTAVGVGWIIIRPLITMLIFTFVFGMVANLGSGNNRYGMIVLTGLLPWMYFSNSLSEVGNCISNNMHLVAKVYFPRLVLPISALIGCTVDFMVACSLLIIMLVIYGIEIEWRLIFVSCSILMSGLLGSGLGMVVASVSLKYRDVKQLVPFILQVGMYISPVGYKISAVPEKYQIYYDLNPLVGIIELFRWSVLGGEMNFKLVLISASVSVIIFVVGIACYKKNQKNMADFL